MHQNRLIAQERSSSPGKIPPGIHDPYRFLVHVHQSQRVGFGERHQRILRKDIHIVFCSGRRTGGSRDTNIFHIFRLICVTLTGDMEAKFGTRRTNISWGHGRSSGKTSRVCIIVSADTRPSFTLSVCGPLEIPGFARTLTLAAAACPAFDIPGG